MIHKEKTIVIIGGGIWGSTLASIAKENNYPVKIWSRSSKEDLTSVIADHKIIVSAVSMAGVTPTIEKLSKIKLSSDTIIVTATKGLDSNTTKTPCQLWQEAFSHLPIVVLSGPNLSKEIQQGLPAATVVASSQEKAAITIQTIFASEKFRVYINNDPKGTELGGTLKNVYAIAAGVCDSLNLGTNAKAALITRALAEIIRIGTHLGASSETFFGLSGLGDLLATCNSPLSRNYQVGYKLGKGYSLEKILAEVEGTAEGLNTTNVLIELAKQEKISVPITDRIYCLLKGETTPMEAVKALMERDLKSE